MPPLPSGTATRPLPRNCSSSSKNDWPPTNIPASVVGRQPAQGTDRKDHAPPGGGPRRNEREMTAGHRRRRADAAGALDLVLTGAALSQFRRFRPGWETSAWPANSAGGPTSWPCEEPICCGSTAGLRSAPRRWRRPKGDRRFADVAWTDNPLLHRCFRPTWPPRGAAETVITDAHLDYRDDLRVRFLRRQSHRRHRPEQQPGPQPGGVEGRHRHRRSQPAARCGPAWPGTWRRHPVSPPWSSRRLSLWARPWP